MSSGGKEAMDENQTERNKQEGKWWIGGEICRVPICEHNLKKSVYAQHKRERERDLAWATE